MSIHDENKTTFEADGFVVVRNLMNESVLAQISEELEELKAKVESREYRGNHMFDDDVVARAIFNPYDFSPAYREFIDTPEVIGLVRELLGTPVRLDHTKLMCKPAGKGSVVHPHQDYYYWQDKNPNQLAMFIAIDPCTEENGCLRLFPGSHKEGLRAHTKKFHDITGERHWVCELEAKYLEKETLFTAKPGDACLFSSLVAHRSDPNTSSLNRRCVVAEFDELGNLEENPGWGSPIPPKSWS
ncbi:MAG: phytanoyl-CoA dioxygenase family protein [Spirochaetales bacterium]|nr:phytanoyl-CoA dioxygenase family protein [Spirochaetales bacterium]